MTRVGSQTPRWECRAPGAVGSKVDDVVEVGGGAGLVFDPWQLYWLAAATAVRDTGLWAALEAALLVPRQNGKTGPVAALMPTAVTRWGMKQVIYTAHEFKTALEAYAATRAVVETSPDLMELGPKFRRSGVETGIEFPMLGANIRFLARTGGSGRGFTGDLIVFDESFALRADMVEALLPTLSARPNPLVIYLSSAPLSSSEQLHNIRRQGLAMARGEALDEDRDEDLTVLEWSAEEGASPGDWDAIYQANPALGLRLTERFVVKERRRMSERGFGRERLGIPDDPDGLEQVDVARWTALTDEASEPLRPLGYGIGVTWERDSAAIGAAGVRPDGLVHVEVVEHLPGVAWLVDRCVEIWDRHQVPFWVELDSPAVSFVGPLEARGVEVRTRAKGAGHAPLLVDGVKAASLRHLGQASLTSALVGAARRNVGDSWTWNRRSSADDISPLEGVTLAHYGAVVEPAPPPKRKARVL